MNSSLTTTLSHLSIQSKFMASIFVSKSNSWPRVLTIALSASGHITRPIITSSWNFVNSSLKKLFRLLFILLASTWLLVSKNLSKLWTFLINSCRKWRSSKWSKVAEKSNSQTVVSTSPVLMEIASRCSSFTLQKVPQNSSSREVTTRSDAFPGLMMIQVSLPLVRTQACRFGPYIPVVKVIKH